VRTLKSPAFLMLMVAVAVIFGFNIYHTVTHQNNISNDFLNYALFILHMKSAGTITTPHFIYPVLVLLASEIFPHHNTMVLGGYIVLLFQFLLGTILWKFWKETYPAFTSAYIIVALTLAAMLLAPIDLLTLAQHDGYNGYIGITIYHNPPVMICRSIALLNVMIFAAALTKRWIGPRQMIFCFLTLVLAALMKPNYALIMVPAAAVFAIVAVIEKDQPLLRFILFGAILPGLLVLGWQYLFTYISPPVGSEMDASRILFAPFLVYSKMSESLLPKFLLSILFPLSILLLFRTRALRDRYYMLGLLLFLMGAIQSYFFAESGIRIFKGNFLWSGQLGLFLWFVISLRFVVQQFYSERAEPRWSATYIALSGIFALHVVSGIIWYVLETTSPGAYWPLVQASTA
jgi:hypothetical protein